MALQCLTSKKSEHSPLGELGHVEASTTIAPSEIPAGVRPIRLRLEIKPVHFSYKNRSCELSLFSLQTSISEILVDSVYQSIRNNLTRNDRLNRISRFTGVISDGTAVRRLGRTFSRVAAAYGRAFSHKPHASGVQPPSIPPAVNTIAENGTESAGRTPPRKGCHRTPVSSFSLTRASLLSFFVGHAILLCPQGSATSHRHLPTIPPRLSLHARVGSGNVDAPAHVRSGG